MQMQAQAQEAETVQHEVDEILEEFFGDRPIRSRTDEARANGAPLILGSRCVMSTEEGRTVGSSGLSPVA